jgi:hypothetical protein
MTLSCTKRYTAESTEQRPSCFQVLANKMDLPKSLNHQALVEAMHLTSIPTDHAWKVMHCCGITGEGVSEGWDWLVDQLNR